MKDDLIARLAAAMEEEAEGAGEGSTPAVAAPATAEEPPRSHPLPDAAEAMDAEQVSKQHTHSSAPGGGSTPHCSIA